MSTLKTYRSKTSNKLFRFVPEAKAFWYQSNHDDGYHCSICTYHTLQLSEMQPHYYVNHGDILRVIAAHNKLSKPFKDLYLTDIFIDLDKDPPKYFPAEKEYDPVNHPSHFTFGKYEVLPVLMDWFPDQPLLWQVVKYLSCAKHKGAYLQDLKKAEFYLKRAIEDAEKLE